MTILGLCILFNIFIIVYFTAKKWKFVAGVYIFALLVLTAITLLLFEEKHTVNLIINLFGENGYEQIAYSLEVFSYGAFLPYLAIEFLSILIVAIIALKATENFILYIKKKCKKILFYSNDKKRWIVSRPRPIVKNEKRKVFLSKCLILS